jgi:hypothetical protein
MGTPVFFKENNYLCRDGDRGLLSIRARESNTLRQRRADNY